MDRRSQDVQKYMDTRHFQILPRDQRIADLIDFDLNLSRGLDEEKGLTTEVAAK